jgi:ATP-dependent DNA helicase RecG
MNILSDANDNNLLRIKGIGSALASKLEQAGIHTICDLLFHLPLRYEDRTTIVPIRSLKNGTSGVTEGVITHCRIQFGKKRSLVCQLQDDSGSLQLRFFHFNKAQQQSLSKGTELRVFGTVSLAQGGLCMIHPEYESVLVSDGIVADSNNNALTPVYPSVNGLHQQRWRKWIRDAFEKISPEALPNLISSEFFQRSQL